MKGILVKAFQGWLHLLLKFDSYIIVRSYSADFVNSSRPSIAQLKLVS